MKNASQGHFNWNLIPSFLAALERGSLLAASKYLGVAQPTVGRHIEELEAQLQVALFERTGRGLKPTAAALSLAETANVMKSAAGQLATMASGQNDALEGTVRLSASTPVATYLLPRILSEMRNALPQIQVELVASNAVSNLLDREADIALRMIQPEQASIVAKRIGSVSLGIYARRDYLAKFSTPRVLPDLIQHALIGGDLDTTIVDGLAQSGVAIQRGQFVFRTDDLVVQWQAIRAGLGIGFVSNYVAQTDMNVVRILGKHKIPEIPLWLVVHREIKGSKRIRAVFDFLAQEVPRHLAKAVADESL
jgi:DNA-binding transcriptional LysR family regulator